MSVLSCGDSIRFNFFGMEKQKYNARVETSNITIQFILVIFPDRHINFWTTVEDGNLSQTFFLVNIIIWKYKYKIRLSTFDMWETPIHYYHHYYFRIFYNRAWAKPYDNLKDAFRCQSSLSVSRHKKSVNIKKQGQVLGMGRRQRARLCARPAETWKHSRASHCRPGALKGGVWAPPRSPFRVCAFCSVQTPVGGGGGSEIMSLNVS